MLECGGEHTRGQQFSCASGCIGLQPRRWAGWEDTCQAPCNASLSTDQTKPDQTVILPTHGVQHHELEMDCEGELRSVGCSCVDGNDPLTQWEKHFASAPCTVRTSQCAAASSGITVPFVGPTCFRRARFDDGLTLRGSSSWFLRGNSRNQASSQFGAKK